MSQTYLPAMHAGSRFRGTKKGKCPHCGRPLSHGLPGNPANRAEPPCQKQAFPRAKGTQRPVSAKAVPRLDLDAPSSSNEPLPPTWHQREPAPGNPWDVSVDPPQEVDSHFEPTRDRRHT